MNRRREAAIVAIEQRCPRCSASRDAGQEYCIECGFHLPRTRGALPALRRRWLRSIGWYPGDWVWLSTLALVVAIAGAAVAIAFGAHTTGSNEATVVARAPHPVAKPPSGRSDWTVILYSYPAGGGSESAAAAASAAHATDAGLPQVGVLDSSGFSSLQPGYEVVFSGVYSSAGEATAALETVRAAGFSDAYVAQISR